MKTRRTTFTLSTRTCFNLFGKGRQLYICVKSTKKKATRTSDDRRRSPIDCKPITPLRSVAWSFFVSVVFGLKKRIFNKWPWSKWSWRPWTGVRAAFVALSLFKSSRWTIFRLFCSSNLWNKRRPVLCSIMAEWGWNVVAIGDNQVLKTNTQNGRSTEERSDGKFICCTRLTHTHTHAKDSI